MSATSYSKLDPMPIRATIEQLHDRIRERFPESGLSRVAAELAQVARDNETVVVQLRRPIVWLRALTVIAVIALVSLALWVVYSFAHAQDLQDAVVLEAVNDVETLTADLSRKVWQKITILDVTAATPERT